MTAPTPDLGTLIQRLRDVIDTAVSDSSTAASQMNVTNADDEATSADQVEAENVRDLVIATLAAVTAERDQAREELSKARDDSEIWMNCYKEARQMLADAPHEFPCMADLPQSPANYVCCCWKAGL